MKQSETGKGSENVGVLEREFFYTVQNAQKPHPTGLENTAIPQFKIKITEIPQEKLSNTAIRQTPMSPSLQIFTIAPFARIELEAIQAIVIVPIVVSVVFPYDRPDGFVLFWDDWDDRDDHMETRLKGAW